MLIGAAVDSCTGESFAVVNVSLIEIDSVSDLDVALLSTSLMVID